MIGRLSSESLLLAAPWFLLPAAVAIGTTHTSVWRRVMAVSLAVVAGIGWYGVFARVYYATPIFIEPWGDLAVEAGSAIRQGGVVVGNDPSFFLYLTYALRASAIHALAFCRQPSVPGAGSAGLGPGRVASRRPSYCACCSLGCGNAAVGFHGRNWRLARSQLRRSDHSVFGARFELRLEGALPP